MTHGGRREINQNVTCHFLSIFEQNVTLMVLKKLCLRKKEKCHTTPGEGREYGTMSLNDKWGSEGVYVNSVQKVSSII